MAPQQKESRDRDGRRSAEQGAGRAAVHPRAQGSVARLAEGPGAGAGGAGAVPGEVWPLLQGPRGRGALKALITA